METRLFHLGPKMKVGTIPMRVLDPDKEYNFAFHRLKPGENIEPHKESVDERLFVYSGSFSISIGHNYLLDRKTFDVLPGTVLYIKIPAGAQHSLWAMSNLLYEVYKG